MKIKILLFFIVLNLSKVVFCANINGGPGTQSFSKEFIELLASIDENQLSKAQIEQKDYVKFITDFEHILFRKDFKKFEEIIKNLQGFKDIDQHSIIFRLINERLNLLGIIGGVNNLKTIKQFLAILMNYLNINSILEIFKYSPSNSTNKNVLDQLDLLNTKYKEYLKYLASSTGDVSSDKGVLAIVHGYHQPIFLEYLNEIDKNNL